MMYLVKFKAHSLLSVLKLDVTDCEIKVRLVFPFEIPPLNFSYAEGKFQEKIDSIVNLYSSQLSFYLNLFIDFEYYKEKLSRYEKLTTDAILESIDYDGRALYMMSLATDFFHRTEGKIPQNHFKMHLLSLLFNSSNLEDYKSLIAPSESIEELESKHKLHIHRSILRHTYRPELMNFSERLN